MNPHESSRLYEIAKLFFKLGCIAFGGPAAHIAMMDKEFIEKRKWITREHFLDIIGATNLIPGPNSTEMTMHLGYERGGWRGLFIAGTCFILPATVITGVLAWLYMSYGELPEVAPFIAGIKPAVIAIIAGAIYKLGKKALKNVELGVLGSFVLLASLFNYNEILALLIGGVLGTVYFYLKEKSVSSLPLFAPFIPLFSLMPTLPVLSTWKIFWTFLKVGAVLYGSGYVLFAYLDAELVANGWLTRPELMDAIAVGQFTPGPVLSTATFIGYQLGGIHGAVAATLGIFLPSFLFVLFLNPLIPKMRKSKLLGYFLDSVNIAAVAVMAGVTFEMGRETLIDYGSWIILLLSVFVTFKYHQIGAFWIVLGGALMGYAFHLL